MVKIRDVVRHEIINATKRLYSAKNYERWKTYKIYGEQIQTVWKMAYSELAERHPQMKWLQMLAKTSSKDITLKLVLRIPDKDVEIDLPDEDRKLGAIAHAGGTKLLEELLEITRTLQIEKK